MVERIKIGLISFVILCSAFLWSACSNSSVNAKIAELTEDGLYKITIRPPDIDTLQDLYLSEIADSVYYVALSDKPLLGPRLRIKKTDNSIVLKDNDGSLKLYDFNGNFKREIGSIGRGAGEYLHPIWTVNKKTDTVYLSAPYVRPNTLSVYSLSEDSDGKMIGRIANIQNITNKASMFYSLGNNILVSRMIFSTRPIELTLYNPQTNIITDSLPNYHNSGGTHNNGYSCATAGYKDELYYMNVYSDTLYRVTEKEIAPFAIFDFGKYKFPIKMTTSDVPKHQKYNIILSSVILKSMLRTSSTLYLRFEYGFNRDTTGFNRFIYALNLDDKTVRYCKPYFINDLDNGPDTWGEMQTIDVPSLKAILADYEIGSKWSFGMLPKDRLFPNNKMVKKLKNIDEFQRLWDKSTEESNPILQFLKLK